MDDRYEFVVRLRAGEWVDGEEMGAMLRLAFSSAATETASALEPDEIDVSDIPADGSTIDATIYTSGGAVLSSASFAVAEDAAAEAADSLDVELVNFGIAP